MKWRTAALIFIILPLIPVRIKTIALYFFLMYLLYQYLASRNILKSYKVNFIKINNQVARINQKFGEYIQRSKNMYLDFIDWSSSLNRAIVPIITMIWILSGLIIVPFGQKCIRIRLGKIIDVVGPGVKYKLPWPISFSYNVNTSKLNKTLHKNISVITNNGNAMVDLVALWKIDDPIKFYKASKYIEEIVANVSKSIIFRRVCFQMQEGNDFERMNLINESKIELQECLDRYNLGIRVVDLQLGEIIK